MIAAPLLAIAACGATAKPAPPRPSTCDAVAAAVAVQLHDEAFAALAKPAAAPDAFARSLASLVGTACTADAWPLATRQCLVDAADDAAIAACPLTAEQRTRLGTAITPLADQHAAETLRDRVCACTSRDCVQAAFRDVEPWGKHLDATYKGPDEVPAALRTAMTELAHCADRRSHDRRATAPRPRHHPDDGTTDWAALLPGGTLGVRACDRFLVLQERYIACDKVPPQARSVMRQSIEQQRQEWSMLERPDVSAEELAAAGDSCIAGTDALLESAEAMGCPLE
ncbi:MAG: hypothetical protein K8W52_05890 [Deltaproteobacteria bacterium]|nr:hypothetical protein [Deltaproteobacteria bacterium]